MDSQQRLFTTSSSSFQTQIQFSRALTTVRSLPITNSKWQPSGHDKLVFYGLYKQALEGDCNIARPSSRLVVPYAKWKAWDQLRQWTPVEAQKHYVALLIDMLSNFVERYPHHELTPYLQKSIHYIQLDSDKDPSAIEIDASGMIENEKKNGSTASSSSYASSNYHHQALSAQVSSSMSPVTPEDTSSFPSKKYHSWNDNHHRHSPTDNYLYYDGISDLDTIDREVAAATSGLGLTAPEQHPYNMPSESRALESLQTDVAALTEQLGHLQMTLAQKRRDKLEWTWHWLGKTLVKHASINLLILFLVFLVLLKRKSPIAYAIIGYVGSRIQDILHYFAQKLYFWKFTV